MGFGIKKNNEPIEKVRLPGGISSGIQYNLIYEQMTALIAAGATIDEIEKWHTGGYSFEFMATIVAWYQSDRRIKNHTEAEINKASKKKK